MTKVISDMVCFNGIVVLFDGRMFYVSDIKNCSWWAYVIVEDGSVGIGCMFFIFNIFEHCETDGMIVDESGCVYMIGGDGFWVVVPDSWPFGMFFIFEFVINVTFGGLNVD